MLAILSRAILTNTFFLWLVHRQQISKDELGFVERVDCSLDPTHRDHGLAHLGKIFLLRGKGTFNEGSPQL